jgi:hypothetical protein
MPAIKPHSTATTDVAWDGPRARSNLRTDGSASYYRSAHAWADPDGDPETKSGYKFIHHMVGSDGDVGAANTRAASAGIAILNGGRGGADIPDGDRKGVHAHLAKHLRDGGYSADDVPPLKQWEYDPATEELEINVAASMRPQSQDQRDYSKAFPFAFKDVTEAGQFEGWAAVFSNVDLQGDRIKRGAFAETIEESGGRWPVLFGHDTGRVVGFSTTAEEDAKGLRVAGEFTLASDEGRNAYATAKHAAGLGQKFGLSIGYGVREGGADYDGETGVRTLKNLTVYEFSLAAIPANPRARISQVKAAGDWTRREFEEHLRDAGFSKQAAARIIAAGFDALDRRDADEGETERAAREFMAELRGKAFLFELNERIY